MSGMTLPELLFCLPSAVCSLSPVSPVSPVKMDSLPAESDSVPTIDEDVLDVFTASELFASDGTNEVEATFDLLGRGKNCFEEYSDTDVLEFINNQDNRNTQKKTTHDVRIFQDFLRTNGELRSPESLPVEDLSKFLSRFLLSVRKKDGTEYEPSSLRGFFSSVDRHLRKLNYPLSLIKDHHFSLCRDALKSKQKQLKSVGKGNKPCASEELTDKEIDKLYDIGQLGTGNPVALINTLWLNNMLYFGMRGGVEQYNVNWGDIQLQTDSDGRQYLEYTQERQTKTRTGENPRNTRTVKPRAYETPEQPDRDPVSVYIEYSKRRPETLRGPDDPFFLGINYDGRSWFKRQKMGINKIYSLMKSMKEKGNLSTQKRLTNHSVRKHLMQKLNDSNIPPNQIIQISGHKNLSSVNNYCSLNDKQQSDISKIIANTKPTNNSELAMNSAEYYSKKQPDPIQPTATTLQTSQYSNADTKAIFQGSSFHNSVVNVYYHPASASNKQCDEPLEPLPKYRRILPLPDESDSDIDI